LEGRNPLYDENAPKRITRESRAMMVKINGDPREVPDGFTVTALLDHLKMRSDRLAIERNLDILPRALWNETQVQPNDSFEIVHFVGGG
jgi:thiamine biosynthesis protein ThiS